MPSRLNPLAEITIADSLSSTCKVEGSSESKFKRDLAKSEYVTTKAVGHWMTGERIPSTFSSENMKNLIERILSETYKDDIHAMYIAYSDALVELGYDMSELDCIFNSEIRFQTLLTFLINVAFSQQKHHSDIEIPLYPDSSKDDDFVLSIQVPAVTFPVDYYVRFVQNGKNEFLPEDQRIPINKDYRFRKTAGNTYTVKIPSVNKSYGFQFKCFALCEEQHADEVLAMLATHFDYSSSKFHYDVEGLNYKKDGRTIPLIDITEAGPDDKPNFRRVWFVLPDYPEYITREYFINNYRYF